MPVTAVVWMAMSITVFIYPNEDGTKDVRSIPVHTFSSYGDCDAWKLRESELERSEYDIVTNKAVDQHLFSCTPISAEQIVKSIQNPSKN